MTMVRNIAAEFAAQHHIHQDDALELIRLAADPFFATDVGVVIKLLNATPEASLKRHFMTLADDLGEDVELTRTGDSQLWDRTVNGVMRAILGEASGNLLRAYKHGLHRPIRDKAAA